jgi:aminopeptidase YwaD
MSITLQLSGTQRIFEYTITFLGRVQRMAKYCALGLLGLLLASLHCASAQVPTPEITAGELREHIKYLASDELEGRGSGTQGNVNAAIYIATQLKLSGLKPAGDNGTFFQSFDFVSAVKPGERNSCVVKGPGLAHGEQEMVLDKDFRPFGFSGTGAVEGRLVFAGYGISASDLSYDDYAGIDVRGKIAVVLRYAPDGSGSQSSYQKYTALRKKAQVARDKGAVGMILLTGPNDDADDALLKLAVDQNGAPVGMPAVSMKRAAFESLMKENGWTLKSLQDTIRATRVPRSFVFANASASLETEITRVMASTANILAYLEGNDPVLKDEVVVVGAHMDHLGWGGPRSGSMMPDTTAIHNGADDNASGTAAVLEIAQAFAAHAREIKRSMLFIFFSGEELGTLGSAYYVEQPFFPLKATVAMLNLDMVGRLQNKALTVGGSGTSPVWNDLLARANADSTFTLSLNPDGFGPSDHATFCGKDVPVLFFFTGTHDDYHKPSDDWDKINYPGEEKVTKYVYRIASTIDTMQARPAFARVQMAAGRGNTSRSGDSRGFTASLGIVPDVGESSTGMKISGVRPNSAAEKAGMKSGDVITTLAGRKVLNVYDYMGVLEDLKAGQEVEVTILRGGTPMKLTAVMQKRN